MSNNNTFSLGISIIMKSSWSKWKKLYHRIVSVQWFDFEPLLRKYLFLLSILYQISSNFLLIGTVGDWKWQGFYAMTFCWATNLIQHYKIPVIVPYSFFFPYIIFLWLRPSSRACTIMLGHINFQVKCQENTTYLITRSNYFIRVEM